jgi:bifunctional non-homologous end joining protein LigD
MAKRRQMPGFIKPQLATLKSKAHKGDHWLHEIKLDPHQVHINAGRKKAYTRNGLGLDVTFSQALPRCTSASGR